MKALYTCCFILCLAIGFNSSLAHGEENPAHEIKEQIYQDWALRCDKASSCTLEQRVFIKGNDKAPLVYIAFRPLEHAKKLVLLLRVPLGVLLEQGVGLQIDGKSRILPFNHCHTQGCLSLTPLSSEIRKTLQSGQKGEVIFFALDGRSITVPFSLAGVTAGLKALEQKK